MRLCSVQLKSVAEAYHNSKQFETEEDEDFEYNEQFRTAVNMNYSGVHIPVEIYEGGEWWRAHSGRDLRVRGR